MAVPDGADRVGRMREAPSKPKDDFVVDVRWAWDGSGGSIERGVKVSSLTEHRGGWDSLTKAQKDGWWACASFPVLALPPPAFIILSNMLVVGRRRLENTISLCRLFELHALLIVRACVRRLVVEAQCVTN